MDPKQQLDPKLQEAYNRVMGGSTPPQPKADGPVIQTTTQINPPPAPASPTSQGGPFSMPHAVPPQTSPQTPLTPVSTSTTTVIQQSPAAPKAPEPSMPRRVDASVPTPTVTTHTTTQIHGFVAPKKKGKISPVIIIAGVVVFILVYALFWIKFFGLNVPFLPQG